jgi:hypothetical protein
MGLLAGMLVFITGCAVGFGLRLFIEHKTKPQFTGEDTESTETPEERAKRLQREKSMVHQLDKMMNWDGRNRE